MSGKLANTPKGDELDDSDAGFDQALDDLRNNRTSLDAAEAPALDEGTGPGVSFEPDNEEDDLFPKTQEPDMMNQEPLSAADDTPAPAFPGPDFSDDAKPGPVPEPKVKTPSAGPGNLDLIMDIPIDMQVVLGTSRLPVSSLMNLSEGSLIGLDRKIGEPVDIVVNGRLFGRGEITLLESEESRFGVKLLEVMGESTK